MSHFSNFGPLLCLEWLKVKTSNFVTFIFVDCPMYLTRSSDLSS